MKQIMQYFNETKESQFSENTIYWVIYMYYPLLASLPNYKLLDLFSRYNNQELLYHGMK